MITSDYNPASYGDCCADFYDEIYRRCDPAVVEQLAILARGGRVLELGIGTGRVALQLAAMGIDIHGIEASAAMIEKLHEKPGGKSIPVTTGRLEEVAVAGEFSLVFALVNTFFLLPTQELQLICFRNAARHLTRDGAFLIEVFNSEVDRDIERTFAAECRTSSATQLKALLGKVDRPAIRSRHILQTRAGLRHYEMEIRSASPSELDLMARLAGLRLRHRSSDFGLASYHPQSCKHVSVYERSD